MLVFAAAALLASCAGGDTSVPAPGAAVQPPAADARNEMLIIAMGDSITAGLGVELEEAYPALLEARLRSEGHAVRVVNSGVSGETTAGGQRRADFIARQRAT